MSIEWLDAGYAHLRAADPRMAGVIERVGPCALAPTGAPFHSLARAMVSQQISIHAAAAIWKRFLALYNTDTCPTPQQVVDTPDETLRGIGFSRTKAVYVKDLAVRLLDGTIPEDSLAAMDDEDIIARLTQVKGIGRWTAEMFLIFALGRPDVLPVDDLGFQIALQQVYALPSRPKPAEIRDIAEPWRPYRSLATWYLWQSRRLDYRQGDKETGRQGDRETMSNDR